MTDYTKDFQAFYRDVYRVEGKYGPQPLIPPFLAKWITTAFPGPSGDPAARNIIDARVKKTGKSSLAGAVVTYMASRKEYSECVIVASDQDQSRDRVLRSVKYAIEHGPLLDHAKVYKDAIEFDNRSTIQAVPFDARGAAGGQYSCIIFDELHTWIYENYRRMFDELIPSPTVDAGVRWIASYAGFSGESLLLQELWQRALSGKRIDKEYPFYRDDKSSLLAFIDTGEAAWRMPWLTPEFMATVKASERPNTYRRLWLNEWVTNESGFLPEGAWDDCYSKEVKPLRTGEKRKVILGADASTSRDFTALVGVEYTGGFSDVVYSRVWRPQKGLLRKGKPTIDLAETIGAEVTRLHEAGQLAGVVCDPYQLHSLIVEWEKAGINVIELAQNAGRVEADQALYDAVIGRTIRHYNDPQLNDALRNAIAIETVRGFRLAKERASMKIDAAVALSMANHGAVKWAASDPGESTAILDPANCSWEDIQNARGYIESGIYEGQIQQYDTEQAEAAYRKSRAIRAFYTRLG